LRVLERVTRGGLERLRIAEVPRGRLVSALVWATVVAAAMAVIALAVSVYTVALVVGASRLALEPNGPSFLSMSTWLSLTLQGLVMAVGATLATVTTLRGWRELGTSISPRP
jgi:hypothetical protein